MDLGPLTEEPHAKISSGVAIVETHEEWRRKLIDRVSRNGVFRFSVLQDTVKRKNGILCFSVLQDPVKRKNGIFCFSVLHSKFF